MIGQLLTWIGNPLHVIGQSDSEGRSSKPVIGQSGTKWRNPMHVIGQSVQNGEIPCISLVNQYKMEKSHACHWSISTKWRNPMHVIGQSVQNGKFLSLSGEIPSILINQLVTGRYLMNFLFQACHWSTRTGCQRRGAGVAGAQFEAVIGQS